MAGDLAGGAALGAVFGELLKAIKDVAYKAAYFNSILKRLESTLDGITPMIEDTERLNILLDGQEMETRMFTDRLREGEKLLRKCAKVRWWNYCLCAKPFYATKLIQLEDSLKSFFQIVVQMRQYVDGRRTLVMLNGVDSRLDRIETSGIGIGSGSGSGIVGCCGVPEVPDFVFGFDEPLHELKTKLLKDGEQVVVLSAPGGCGKTTLAKMLCHDGEIEDMYGDNIFFVTFSKAPNLKVIIGQLFCHKGYRVPKFRTEEEAINQLEHMLKQIGPDPILLVLDDVWSGSEFHIEKFKFRILEYKILVTTRSVFPSFFTYKLKLLKDEDAMALFRHSAFPQHGGPVIPNDLVNKIVGGCRGFPLALKVVGRSLNGKSFHIWKDTLKQWSKGQSIFKDNNELLICLQTSFDALDEIKECYLDLASFPEDQRIPAMALMDMWVELHDLDEDGAIVNLHKLSDRNLVNLALARKDASEINGYYNEHSVMQHDLLRELAVHQSGLKPIKQRKRLIVDIKGNDLPSWWIKQRDHPIRARLVSISTDEMFSSNWYNLQLPSVEVLVLNIQARNYTLPQFMEKNDQLKVLIITNYGLCSAQISHFPLLGHLSSLKRIRLEHISLSSISMLQLRNLQKISLVMCEIDEAFRNCTIQIPNMFLSLAEIVIDYCNDLVELPVWLCNVSCLQKLSITNCHELVALPEVIGKLENLEVLRLHACTKLLKLPESLGSLQKLYLLDLSGCIRISKLPERMGALCALRKLDMRGCWGLSELPSSVKDLKQSVDLICDEEVATLWEGYDIDLTNLELNVLKEDVNLDWLL